MAVEDNKAIIANGIQGRTLRLLHLLQDARVTEQGR